MSARRGVRGRGRDAAIGEAGGSPASSSGSLVGDGGYFLSRHSSLVDAVDHLLNRGAVIAGEAKLSLAGVDLVYLGLNVMISSVETLREGNRSTHAARWRVGAGRPPDGATAATASASRTLETQRYGPDAGSQLAVGQSENVRSGVGDNWPAEPIVPDAASHFSLDGARSGGRPRQDPTTDGTDKPERGLARLVLTLIELLRQILERQAIRRMDGGGLSDAEVEGMGMALLELEEKMAELRAVFHLGEDDLNLDLGPLGTLL